MKISIVDADAIRKNLLNTSQSKQGYSFSKTNRFNKPFSNCPRAYYESNDKTYKRSTSFGYGNRSDFTKTLTSSPAVTKYNPEINMYSSKRPEKGKSFGLSRDQLLQNGTLVKGIQKNPGVGAYNASVQTSNNIKYTMRSKTLDVFHKHNSSRATPGPAAYNHRDQFPLNRFYSAKYESPCLGVINKTQRFSIPKQSPGPLQYVTPDNLSSSGKYTVSKHRGQGTRPFSQNARVSFTDRFAQNKAQNPGPGQYQKHSQFGVYGDHKYFKTMTSFGKFNDIKKANETH